MGHRPPVGVRVSLHPVDEVVAFLLGRWTVVREIADENTSATGTFRGSAEFVPDGTGLRWVETGELDWAGHRRKAGHRLRISPGAATGSATVTFDDGRFFHPLDLATGSSHFVHDCAPDRYTGSLTVASPRIWHPSWDVDGPAKQLRLRSTYRRG
jgi:hypothetical protein